MTGRPKGRYPTQWLVHSFVHLSATNFELFLQSLLVYFLPSEGAVDKVEDMVPYLDADPANIKRETRKDGEGEKEGSRPSNVHS